MECSVCDPAKIFAFYIQVQLYTYLQPTHKTETRTANRWGTTNSKPPGPIIMTSTPFAHPLDQLAQLASLLLPSHQFHLAYWLVVSNSQIVVNAKFS
jgi:hypothetical protein